MKLSAFPHMTPPWKYVYKTSKCYGKLFLIVRSSLERIISPMPLKKGSKCAEILQSKRRRMMSFFLKGKVCLMPKFTDLVAVLAQGKSYQPEN